MKLSIFTKEQEKILLKYKFTNWLWGKWDNIDKLVKISLEKMWKYIWLYHPDKLYKEIYRLHFLHDILYSVASSKIEFIIANYIFVRDLWKILYKIPFIKRILIQFTIFIILQKYWTEYIDI